MTRTFLTLAAALSATGLAFADTGAHSHGILAQIIHWMSSPAHGLFSVIALIAAGAAATYLIRKKA